jgi:predicted hotdog family 3-hydroxylacyl-ACP dehydratase
MEPSSFEILSLIPQRPPMQMIDTLTSVGERSARGSLFIKESNMFVTKGGLSESALIEFIAQTAAAYTGYRNKINSENVTEGYIGAVKNLVIHSLPAINTTIESEIEVVNEIVGFTIIMGRVFYNESLIAECEMRILARPQ